MKRFLLIFLCVLSLCSLFVVSASAADSYLAEVTITNAYGELDVPLYFGSYDFIYHSKGSVFTFSHCFYVPEDCASFISNENANVKLNVCDMLGVSTFSIDSAEFRDGTLLIAETGASSNSSGTTIFDVFTSVGNFIPKLFNNAVNLFWNAEAGSLTLVGSVSVAGVAFAVIFLIVSLLRKFLVFRG